ncbi:MAG TPA: UDP-glucose/GDP-mannose dehydrogenase family protein, partial [Acidobacteriaceae bacterium]|nr:UDP-glucose/GDP-mannose dehydrogenase family protein [Acidobacteriaceae bacterium]
VGLVAAACFAEIGHRVFCVDNDEAKVKTLNEGGVPIHEEFLPELLERHRSSGQIQFTTDLRHATQQSQAIFIAVGTPQSETGNADLSYVDAVASEIARSIDSYKVIVEKSTVPVYTNDWIRRTIERNGVSRSLFDVASNPEFLREGTAVKDFLHPDRIVLGADSSSAADLLAAIYRPLSGGAYYDRPGSVPGGRSAADLPPVLPTSTKAAEIIKHASNAFLAMKISFINVVANLCEAVDADVEQVARGMGLDQRIGNRFLSAGVGYGGSCFPKDVAAFRYVAQELGIDFGLLKEVEKINESQKSRFFQKVRSALWTLRGKRLGVLGLAFKGGTDDIRESPALEIIEMLREAGATIYAYDPAAMERAKCVLPADDSMHYVDDPFAAADNADALLILTDWADFGRLDLSRLRYTLRYPIVIDGRNLYDPRRMQELGFTYLSVGRPAPYTSFESASTKRWP